MLTYADLLETPDDGKRYEILEGDLYVTAAPNLAHQHCVGMQIYGQYGLPHYWLVDPCARFVEAYGLVAGRYELVSRAPTTKMSSARRPSRSWRSRSRSSGPPR